MQWDFEVRLYATVAAYPFFALMVLIYVVLKVWSPCCRSRRKSLRVMRQRALIMAVLIFLLSSVAFLKVVMMAFPCGQGVGAKARTFLIAQPDVECDAATDPRYGRIRTTAWAALGLYLVTFLALNASFLSRGGQERFLYLTDKMEDNYYWRAPPLHRQCRGGAG